MDNQDKLSTGDWLALPLLVFLFGLVVLLDELREIGWQRVYAKWRLRRAQARVRQVHAFIVAVKQQHAQAMTLLQAELQVAVDKVHALDDLAEGRVS